MAYKDKLKQKEYQKKWQAKHRKHRTKEQLELNTLGNIKRCKERISWLNALRAEFKCERCGENHPAVLDFHHKNKEEKEFNIPVGVRSQYSKERILKEIAKCSVLCANCHRILHYEERTMSMG